MANRTSEWCSPFKAIFLYKSAFQISEKAILAQEEAAIWKEKQDSATN